MVRKCIAYVLCLASLLIAACGQEVLEQQAVRRHKGIKRGFKAEGGAAAYLKQLNTDDPQKLNNIRKRSRVEALPVPALAQMLDQDADLGLDLDNDVLVFECEGLVQDDKPQDATLEAAGFAPDPLASQAFQLSSRPSATRKIYLDFTGASISGTSWNNGRNATIVQPPYDKDNNPSSFSTDELNDIVAVWRAVSEDYAIFDVDVTTIRPATFQGNQWVSIGGNAAWYGSAVGGVASVGIFGNPYFQPAFVFPQQLGPNYAKYVWEAASHEIGHTLGLFHDGVVGGSPYYSGQGDWAPIMGTGYTKTLTTFDKGEYTNSNQPQDDIATISSFLPMLTPSAGNSTAAAMPLTVTVAGATATGTASGVVTQQGVANYFSFSAGAAGTATFEVDVMLPWSTHSWARTNLDVLLTIYDSSNNVIASINPAGVASANSLGFPATTVQLPAAGTYYAAVSGAGSGDVKATGYSSYGIRGSFQITAVYPASGSVNPNPNPVPSPSPQNPVPSPSPQNPVPSPSPQNPATPSPSPPPAPQQAAVKISEIRVSKSCTTTSCVCSARMFLVNAATGLRMTTVPVSVGGSWTASPVPNWQPYPATVSGTSNSRGLLDLKAPRQKLSGSCTFTATSVTAAGYLWDPSSVTTGTIDLTSSSKVRRFRAATATPP